jgi:hypothetical protein
LNRVEFVAMVEATALGVPLPNGLAAGIDEKKRGVQDALIDSLVPAEPCLTQVDLYETIY